MSEPVTNVEIEDVLSSIRRLVADSDWNREPFDKKVEKPAPANDGKFVLTPALRVEGEDEPVAAPVAVETSHDAFAFREAAAPAPAPQNEDVAAVEVADVIEELPVEDEEPHESEPEAFDEQAHDDFVAEGQDRRTELERMIAELEAAVDHDEEWEPEADIQIEDEPEAPRRIAAADEVEDAEFTDDAAEEPITFHHHATQADPVLAADLDEGDLDDDQYYDHDDNQDDERDADIAAVMDGGDDIEEYLDGDGMIDEAMLRELVTDIVRQELQGALGERITRNVRKLVRREIYRVLSSQEFE